MSITALIPRAMLAALALATLAACGGGGDGGFGDRLAGGIGNALGADFREMYDRDERSGKYQAITVDGRFASVNVDLRTDYFSYALPGVGYDGRIFTEHDNRLRYELRPVRADSSRISLPKGELVGALYARGERTLAIGTEKFTTSLDQVTGVYNVLARVCENGICRGAVSRVEIARDGTFTSQHAAGETALLPASGRLDNRASAQVFELYANGASSHFGALRFINQAGGYHVLVAAPARLEGQTRAFAFGLRQGEPQHGTDYWKGWDHAGVPRDASFDKRHGHAAIGRFHGPLDRHDGEPGLIKLLSQEGAVFVLKNDRLLAALRPQDGFLMLGTQHIGGDSSVSPRLQTAPEYAVRH